MSDVLDEDDRFLGRQLLRKSRSGPLRERMRVFAAEHAEGDVQRVRRRLSAGDTDVSELVSEGRDERV